MKVFVITPRNVRYPIAGIALALRQLPRDLIGVFRVERYPYFGVILADGRVGQFPRCVRYLVPFLNPQDVNERQPLDILLGYFGQADKENVRAVGVVNGRVRYAV